MITYIIGILKSRKSIRKFHIESGFIVVIKAVGNGN